MRDIRIGTYICLKKRKEAEERAGMDKQVTWKR
jgi:hypothetical protein